MERKSKTWLTVLWTVLFALATAADVFAGEQLGERRFRIVQISDTQPSLDEEAAWKTTEESIDLVNRLKPDLVFFAGDITDTGTEVEYQRMREAVGRINAPVYPVPGNHDVGTPANKSEAALPFEKLYSSKTQLYRNYFGQDAWSFGYGDYLFVGFDTTEAGDELTPERRFWLESVLRESSEPYKVIVAHYDLRTPVANVLDSYGVVAYMHGHTHAVSAAPDPATGRLILSSGSGSAVQIQNYGVMCIDVYDQVWRVSWHPVKSEPQDLGEFNVEEALKKVWRPHATFTKGPYVQNLTPTSATIKWETFVRPDASVIYKESEGQTWISAASTPARILHEVRLTGLTPGAEYDYFADVASKGEGARSGVARFRTPLLQPNEVRFVIYADTRSHPKTHAAVVRAILDHAGPDIDFVVHAGDLVSDGSIYRTWGPEFFAPARELVGRIPVYPVLGNHEGHGENYFKLFALPGRQRFYSRHLGPVHIAFLDSNWSLKPESEQYKWLARDLEESAAPWKFVVCHHPVFSSGPHGTLNNRGVPIEVPIADLRNHVAPLLEKHGVSIVFSGHDHIYERSKKGSVYYITTGGGGAELYEPKQDKVQNPYSEVLKVQHHFCLVEADARRVKMSVVALDRSKLDQIELTRSVPVSAKTQ